MFGGGGGGADVSVSKRDIAKNVHANAANKAFDLDMPNGKVLRGLFA